MVYDISNEESFEEINLLIEELQDKVKNNVKIMNYNKKPHGCKQIINIYNKEMVIAIVGNKSDMEHADHKVSDEEVEKLAKKF